MDPTFLIILLLGAAAMFLLSNRSRKQQKVAQDFRKNLEVGDEVMTHGGLFGTVVDIDGDVITLESPSGGRTDWLRAAISKLATPPFAAPGEDDEEADEEYEDDLEEYEDDVDEYEDDVDEYEDVALTEDEDALPPVEDAPTSQVRLAGEDDADRRA
jgi:preprotein translocase subunit YajC